MRFAVRASVCLLQAQPPRQAWQIGPIDTQGARRRAVALATTLWCLRVAMFVAPVFVLPAGGR